MEIYGIDFTSRPRRRKPITSLHCKLDEGVLRAIDLEELPDFVCFERALQRTGPWIAGVDFPFGQSRRFIDNIGWPQDWEAYVLFAEGLGRVGFRHALTTYRQGRQAGDKEHRRLTDIAAGSISPQKLYGVPVGLMFFEGAPRLVHAGVTIPRMRSGDPQRIVVEVYPGVLARNMVGRRSYKSDTKKKQTASQREARQDLFQALTADSQAERLGFRVIANPDLIEDPTGDHLDALLCAVQATWAWQNRAQGYGIPESMDPLEGWIVDSSCGNLPTPAQKC